MAKIKIHSKIKNISTNKEEELECMGILDKNKIVYKDNYGINEIILGEDEIVFVKKREDKTCMKFSFQKNICNTVDVTLKDYSLKLPLFTHDIIQKKNYIEIIYQIDNNEKFSFIFEYEC